MLSRIKVSQVELGFLTGIDQVEDVLSPSSCRRTVKTLLVTLQDLKMHMYNESGMLSNLLQDIVQ